MLGHLQKGNPLLMLTLNTLNAVVVVTGLITIGVLSAGGAAGAICGTGASKMKSARVRTAYGTVFGAVAAASATMLVV